MLEEPNCYTRGCKNFIGVSQPDGTELTERIVCKAFPNGIPFDIAYGPNKHLEPIKGQKNDIVFKESETS